MLNEIIIKKLDQISKLLDELERLLDVPLTDFRKNLVNIRAAERNFQLIVDLAIDINTQILLGTGEKTPDTYRQSFNNLGQTNVLSADLANSLSASAGLRNILVHEYDFEEDYEKFYHAVRKFIPLYRTYCQEILKYSKQ